MNIQASMRKKNEYNFINFDHIFTNIDGFSSLFEKHFFGCTLKQKFFNK